MSKKLTQEQFIERAIEVHGNKYEYDKSVYVNSRTLVEIYCNNCKKYFWQTPNKHLASNNCGLCSKNRIKTKEQFIIDAKVVHGDKYGYDRVVYTHSKLNIEIYCNNCNKYFWQTANSHLAGYNCGLCSKNRIKTKEQFIKEAINIHGNKYGYDKAIYNGTDKIVSIFCNECKKYFPQTPANHLKSQGCPICGHIKKSKSKTKTTEKFIIDAKVVHGDKYGYNKVAYIHNKQNVEIYCKKCQKYFWQTPHGHLRDQGCPICNESKGEKEVRKYLEKYGITYIIQKRFNDCKNKRALPFDVYLPDFNICIEYQGQQHYSLLTGYIHKKFTLKEQQDNFKRQKKHDKIKKDYCLKNNIQLIEIPYWDFKKIEEYIVNINTSKEVIK